MNLFNRYRTYLEFGEDYLKVIQLKGKNLIYNKIFEVEGDFAQIDLNYYLTKAPYPVKEVYLLVADNRLLIRNFNLPLTAKDKVDKLIKLNTIPELPYSGDELYYTYYQTKRDEQLNILFFATTKEFIDNSYKKCSDLKLLVKGIFPATLIHYLINGRLFMDGKIYSNSQDLLALSLDHWKGGIFFFTKDNTYIRTKLRPSRLLQEVDNTLIHLENETVLGDYLIFIDGEEIAYDSLEAFLQQRVGGESSWIWDNFVEVEKGLREASFLKQLSYDRGRKKVALYKELTFFLALILIVNGISLNLYLKSQEKALGELENELERVGPLVEKVHEIQADHDNKSLVLDGLKEEVTFNYGYLPWLEELTRVLSHYNSIEQINFKGDKLILLEGKSSSATKTMNGLRDSDYFENLYFIGSIIGEEDGERFRIAGDLIDEFNR